MHLGAANSPEARSNQLKQQQKGVIYKGRGENTET
jgi:hypothetical protein